MKVGWDELEHQHLCMCVYAATDRGRVGVCGPNTKCIESLCCRNIHVFIFVYVLFRSRLCYYFYFNHLIYNFSA